MKLPSFSRPYVDKGFLVCCTHTHTRMARIRIFSERAPPAKASKTGAGHESTNPRCFGDDPLNVEV